MTENSRFLPLQWEICLLFACYISLLFLILLLLPKHGIERANFSYDSYRPPDIFRYTHLIRIRKLLRLVFMFMLAISYKYNQKMTVYAR
jgi:hypothetical protein